MNHRWWWLRRDTDLVEHKGDLNISCVSAVEAHQTWALG